MTRLRITASVVVVALVALVCSGSSPAAAFTPMSCPVGSANLRLAVSETLAGLDRSDFVSFDVGAPPPISHGHYNGSLSASVTLAGSDDPATHSQEKVWEAYLAQGAIGTRCSAGHRDVSRVMTGGWFRFATDATDDGGGQGVADARLVVGAQGEPDRDIEHRAEHILASYGLTATSVRVLHPLGPALQVFATVRHAETVEGRIDQLMTALGNVSPPEYDGLYLAVDTADGRPLVQAESAVRAGEGGFWEASGFDSGIAHG